ncbi:MAG: hypothetical protein IT210_11295 [Armatimonadetes bacterium]|nr:hypothetical protein [Armatimonadota bacterium]
MTIQEATIEKIKQLPDPLAREVGNFVDFLLIRYRYWVTCHACRHSENVVS